ncbi:uncharacterized protein FFB14_06118 [Fusarium fujikuroi]|nr:uncharacterized protein FFB14_06118 [Fusarium fujikuroi]
MSEEIILCFSKTSDSSAYNVLICIPDPTDPNPQSPISWIFKGPVTLAVTPKAQSLPGICFDETNDLLLMALWPLLDSSYALRISSHLDVIDSTELAPTAFMVVGETILQYITMATTNGCAVIKTIVPSLGGDVDNVYWIRQPSSTDWYKITMTPSPTQGFPSPLPAVNGQLICPASRFPNFTYMHYLSMRASYDSSTWNFYLDSFQPQYLPTNSDAGCNCTRTQIQLDSSLPFFFQAVTSLGYTVTSKAAGDTEAYLLYIFWSSGNNSAIYYQYIELESDGSLNTATDIIKGQGSSFVTNMDSGDADSFSIVQAMGRVFCFVGSGSSCMGMTSSIESDGTIQGDWVSVSSSRPPSTDIVSCISVPKSWYSMPSSLE